MPEPTPDELLPALHEIKWIPGQHYAIQLDEHYKRLHAAYLALLAERDRLRVLCEESIEEIRLVSPMTAREFSDQLAKPKEDP